MTYVILILCLLITGCETAPIKTEDRIVKVVVKEKCSPQKVNKPDFPAAGLKKEDALDTKVATVLADIERRKAYEKELEAAAKECE
jgi:hypothetical protein